MGSSRRALPEPLGRGLASGFVCCPTYTGPIGAPKPGILWRTARNAKVREDLGKQLS